MPNEPWMKFKQFVQVPPDIRDSQVQPNMRFQFMFTNNAEADRILATLPQKYAAALTAAECWWRGLNSDGKFQIAWDQVRLTVPDGIDLMNRVVNEGGEIYEAFLD